MNICYYKDNCYTHFHATLLKIFAYSVLRYLRDWSILGEGPKPCKSKNNKKGNWREGKQDALSALKMKG